MDSRHLRIEAKKGALIIGSIEEVIQIVRNEQTHTYPLESHPKQ